MSRRRTESTSNASVVPTLTEDDIAALRASLAPYKEAGKLHGDAKKEARKNALRTALDELKGNHPNLPKVHWEAMKMLAKSWLNSHGRIRQPRTPYVGRNRWNLSRVVAHVKKEEVTKRVCDISGAKPGNKKQFMGSYQGGLSQVVGTLLTEEREVYQTMAAEWNRAGLPLELRRKQADRNGRRWLKEMAVHGWKTYGMRMIIFEAHFNGKEEAVYSRHDFNNSIGEPGGDSFEGHSDGDVAGQFELLWSEYAYSALLRDSGRVGNESRAPTAARQPPAIVDLECDKYGLPLLPPLKPDIKTNEINSLIRSFLVIHYRKMTQKAEGAVHIPWGRISEEQEEFIDAEYLPELFTLAEPTRKRLEEKRALVQFWLKRQNNPNIKHAFLFKAYLSGDDIISYDYITAGGGEKGAPKRSHSSNTKGRKSVSPFTDENEDTSSESEAFAWLTEHDPFDYSNSEDSSAREGNAKAAESEHHNWTEADKHMSEDEEEENSDGDTGSGANTKVIEEGPSDAAKDDTRSIDGDDDPRKMSIDTNRTEAEAEAGQVMTKGASSKVNSAPVPLKQMEAIKAVQMRPLAGMGSKVQPRRIAKTCRDTATVPEVGTSILDRDESSNEGEPEAVQTRPSAMGRKMQPRKITKTCRDTATVGTAALDRDDRESRKHEPDHADNDNANPAPIGGTSAGPAGTQQSPRRQTPTENDTQDLTRVTRSRTPSAKRREMEERNPTSQAAKKVCMAVNTPKPKARKATTGQEIGDLRRPTRTMRGRLAEEAKARKLRSNIFAS